MRRSSFTNASAVVATLAVAAGAQAALFSFASDGNSSQWTLAGSAQQTGGFFNINSPLTTPLTLLVDDNNGPLPSLSVQANLVVNLTGRLANSAPLFGSTYEHDYFIDGSIQFVNPANASDVWLTIKVGSATGAGGQPGRLTVIGNQATWGTAGNLNGSSSTASVSYTASASFQALLDGLASGGASAASYGVAAGTTSTNTDFGLTLTVLNAGNSTDTSIGNNVGLDGQTKLPVSSWRSEGSFSGSATIPAPTATALLGLAGVLSARRRRA